MSASQQNVDRSFERELMAVVEAAGARLRAETDQDADAARAATETLLSAATSAMSAGFSLSEIAAAEARGKADIRSELCPDTLRRVERSARHAREAEREHHRMIARAMRLGLSTREIAVAAGVTHGTVRAIASRLAAAASSTDAGEDQPPEPPGEGDSSDG